MAQPIEITLKPEYGINQTVYFMDNNKVCKSTINRISFPSIWMDKRGKMESTSFRYYIKASHRLTQFKISGIPKCILFSSKKELLKSL